MGVAVASKQHAQMAGHYKQLQQWDNVQGIDNMILLDELDTVP